MISFAILFYRIFKRIKRSCQKYYIAYASIIILVYIVYSLLPFLYGQMVDNVGYYENYVRLFSLYIIFTYATVLSFRAWSIGNIYIQKVARNSLSNAVFETSLVTQQVDHSLFTVHLQSIAKLFLDYVYTIPSEIVVFTMQYLIIIYFSLNNALLVFMEIFLFALLTIKKGKKIIPIKYSANENYSTLQKTIDELIRHSTDIQLLSKEEWAENRLVSICNQYNRSTILLESTNIFFELLSQISTWVISCLVTLLTLYEFTYDKYSIGLCLIIIQISNGLNSHFASLQQNFNYLINFIPSLDKVNTFLDEVSLDSCIHIKSAKSPYLLKIDCISKSVGRRILFKNLSFTISIGDIVVITGKSGSGKSTLLSIIKGDTAPDNGYIMHKDNSKIGMLYQNYHIFNRSLKDNLLLANPFASMNELHSVLITCSLDQDIKTLSNGINTIIGENGALLSGGQQSRLALAQVLLYNPDVLILDEPLSNVDIETKEKIIMRLVPYLQKKGCIIVTHDDLWLKIASQTIYIEDYQEGETF